MLVCEVRGGRTLRSKGLQEDYLTSAVFGHLRYLPPECFWPSLFGKAEACDDSGSLHDLLVNEGLNVARYESLTVDFWPWKGKRIGRPDLIMKFKGSNMRTLRIVMEVKLQSRKSRKGRGKRRDQLADYCKLLKTPKMLSTFIYLTPRDDWCQEDLDDTFKNRPGLAKCRNRIFRLHWYDLAAVAKAEKRKARHPYGMILSDISQFLQRRELDHAVGRKAKTPTPRAKAKVRVKAGTPVDSQSAFVIDVVSW